MLGQRLYPHSNKVRGRSSAATSIIFLCSLATLLWALTHRLDVFARDGDLYAVQALSRLEPALRSDVYLSDISQDRFTVFSPIYAQLIRGCGIWTAGLIIFALSTGVFFASAWCIVRRLCSLEQAWFAVAVLAVIVPYYGGYSIFHYAENFVTARSVAEAMVALALSLRVWGRQTLGLAVAALALLVHPLMALPGLLLLLCLWVPLRIAVAAALAGVLAATSLAVVADKGILESRLFTLVDGDWLNTVYERSQFLFLSSWRFSDWELHAHVFICLVLSMLALGDARCRRLCAAAVIVGAAGLMVAWVSGSIGPVAILLQGQAWRWFWVSGFVCMLMLAPTVLALWRDGGGGAIAALLVAGSWALPLPHCAGLAAAALGAWMSRGRLRSIPDLFCRKLAIAICIAVSAWSFVVSVRTIELPITWSRASIADAGHLFLGVKMTALIFFAACWRWSKSMSFARFGSTGALTTLVLCCVFAQDSLAQRGTAGTSRESAALQQWIRAIPSSDTVQILPGQNSASFVWFTLRRPSYLTVDQSSGVVFSRITASEIVRRSRVLMPVMDPDWRVATQIKEHKSDAEMVRQLTRERLASICSDPALGFVIAAESVGFAPVTMTAAGKWKGWNLYSCERVRSAPSRT